MKAPFEGSAVALVTPFQDSKVDWDGLERLIEMQVAAETNAIVATGTTGEPATLTHDEHVDVVRFIVEKVAGRIPVIGGSGSNSTAEAVELSKRIEGVGADSLLVVTPYYNKATQEGLRLHFETIADAVEVPIILYNVPSRTAVNLLPETVAALASHPRVAGLKEASGDLSQIIDLFRRCRNKIPIYSGNDDQVFALLSLGGRGVISVAANIIPRQMYLLVDSYLRGRPEDALAIQEEINPLVAQLFTEVNPIPVKAALAKMGLIRNELRLPLTPLSEENSASLFKEMEDYRLI